MLVMSRIACRLIAVCLVFFAAGAQAQQLSHPKTCLVLGGGGARGAAHIGILKILEREHVPIDCITGTSMGAIVGGLYAAGYKANEIEGILKAIDWKDMFQDDPPRDELPMRRKEDELRFLGGIELGLRDGRIAFPRGVIQGQKLQLLLRRLLISTLKVENFDDLPIQFRSIATDIVTGDKIIFAKGDLSMAIRASMSVPAAFAPIRFQGHLLVDGGITDNVPIDVARELGAQRLIVVNVGQPLTSEDQLTSPFSIANQMLTAMMKRQTDAQLTTLGSSDVLLTPNLGDITSADFERTAEAVTIGLATAEESADALRRYSVSDADYAQFAAAHRPHTFDQPLIAFLDVKTNRSRTSGYVEQHLSSVVGKPFDPVQVDKQIGLAYGEGSYERISYDFEDRDGKTGLIVVPVDKGWGPNFLRLGLRLSDNFAGRNSYQLLTELNFTGLNDRGGESRNRVQFGQVTELYSEFLQPFGAKGQFYIAPYAEYQAYNLPINTGESVDLAEYRRGRIVGATELGWTPDASWQFSGALEYGRDALRLRTGISQFPNFSSSFGGGVLRMVFDDLDKSGFPTRGTRVDASEEILLDQLGSSAGAHVVRARWDTAVSSGANTWLFGASINTATGGDNDIQIAAFSPLGGLTNLSGYAENQLFATNTALARMVYYRRLTDAQALFSVPVYLGGSLELGGFWDRRRDIGDNLIPAGSVFLGLETFLGPVFLGYGYARGGHNAAYLTFGSLLRNNNP
jgi:NTE family protein